MAYNHARREQLAREAGYSSYREARAARRAGTPAPTDTRARPDQRRYFPTGDGGEVYKAPKRKPAGALSGREVRAGAKRAVARAGRGDGTGMATVTAKVRQGDGTWKTVQTTVPARDLLDVDDLGDWIADHADGISGGGTGTVAVPVQVSVSFG